MVSLVPAYVLCLSLLVLQDDKSGTISQANSLVIKHRKVVNSTSFYTGLSYVTPTEVNMQNISKIWMFPSSLPTHLFLTAAIIDYY